MTIENTIKAIRALHTENSERVRGYVLRDSDTAEVLTLSDLHVHAAKYAELICESLDCAQAEGHVRVTCRGRPSRRVYAD